MQAMQRERRMESLREDVLFSEVHYSGRSFWVRTVVENDCCVTTISAGGAAVASFLQGISSSLGQGRAEVGIFMRLQHDSVIQRLLHGEFDT